ncbi:hypothetical protein PG994_000904 [Apiospora phragmitis]|uniref:Uncharacterized protein n=1 Tax=Apiospora phragmitis TaxID=2905665 RepID=A0ABR1WQX8_9PEZI
MDYARCAELHNRILDMGIRKQLTLGDGRNDSPHSIKSPPVLQHPNWFQHWGKRAEAVRPYLSPNLTAFLERAGAMGDGHSFFYYVNGLESPDVMWAHQVGMAEDLTDPYRYVTLYSTNQFASYPDGLVFDQKKTLAIMQMSIHDGFVTQNGRQKWYPLEVVLSQWLDMIEVGKVQAVAEGVRSRSEKQGPWTLVGYSERQLEETLEVWEQLLNAIEARIPDHTPSNDSRTLFDDDEIDLEAAGVLPGFMPEFLAKARRPAFHHIAPGLQIRDAESVAFQQPFRSVPLVCPHNRPEYPGSPKIQFPILLFASSEGRTYDAPPSENFYEDGVKLVLPFGIGGRGWARTADGAKFGENTGQVKHADVEGQDMHHSLFQLGYQPFVAAHEVRLVQVLRVWVKLVESGAWKVGPDGILGGMEKWRDADTWWHWKKYVVPMSW